MPDRLLVLAVPSALVLAGLVVHSLVAMPRRRAGAFWVAVLAYGIVRGLGVRWVTEAIGASFPYEVRDPLWTVGGVSAQEVAGWAIVAYLGWWVGYRFSLRARRPWLFLQVAWAALFLGAISWAIEAAAIAARWWHWTVPTASRVFLNVPAIGIVDWFFVGIDFVLPFAAITAPLLRERPARFLTLLLFPAHFAAHLLPGVWLHSVHWLLVIVALFLALRSDVEDRPFTARRDWIPTVAFVTIAVDVALVNLLLVQRPELLQSIVPATVIWLGAIRPALATAAGAASLLAAIQLPSLLVATAVAAGGALLLLLRRRSAAWVAVAAVVVFAVLFHRSTAASRADLTGRLDRAIAERTRGNAGEALAQFDAIARDHPTTHVPLAMAAEIDYRGRRLDAAHMKLARAVEIKQDFVRGYRLLAAIDLQRGRRAEGVAWAARGLEVAPDDVQLRYLAGQEVSEAVDSADTAAGMAALAFEVGDAAGAQRFVSAGLERWPEDPRLRGVAAALARGR